MAGTSFSHERPGFEIDVRSNRKARGLNGEFEVRALSRTLFGARAEVRKFDFDENAVFLGTNLHDELSRTLTAASLTMRHELTPLTSFIVDVGRQQERFDFSPSRDSDSTRSTRTALRLVRAGQWIRAVGFPRLHSAASDSPRYTGSSASGTCRTSALGAERLGPSSTATSAVVRLHQPYYFRLVYCLDRAQIFARSTAGSVGHSAWLTAIRAGSIAVVDRQDKIRPLRGMATDSMDLRLGFNVDQQDRNLDRERRYTA